MISSFFLPIVAAALVLIIQPVDSYLVYAGNDCPGTKINSNIVVFEDETKLVCFENLLIDYDDGGFLFDGSGKLFSTPAALFFSYAYSVDRKWVWDGQDLSDDDTIKAPCGSETPKKMLVHTAIISAAELGTPEDVLVTLYTCNSRRMLSDGDEEDNKENFPHDFDLPSKHPDSDLLDFILHHSNPIHPACQDDQSCKHVLKDHHLRG